MIQLKPVILCSGSGIRLWSLSRTEFPRQFLCLAGKESLFQETAHRSCVLCNSDIQVGASLIITGAEHRFLAAEQLRESGVALGQALLESEGRNTAIAPALAAHAVMEARPDPVLAVTLADQTVCRPAAFPAVLWQATAEADADSYLIITIRPYRPETGCIQAVVAQAGPPLLGGLLTHVAPGLEERMAFRQKRRCHHRTSLSRRWGRLLERGHVGAQGLGVAAGARAILPRNIARRTRSIGGAYCSCTVRVPWQDRVCGQPQQFCRLRIHVALPRQPFPKMTACHQNANDDTSFWPFKVPRDNPDVNQRTSAKGADIDVSTTNFYLNDLFEKVWVNGSNFSKNPKQQGRTFMLTPPNVAVKEALTKRLLQRRMAENGKSVGGEALELEGKEEAPSKKGGGTT